MKKRIRKKMFNRYGFYHHKEYKDRVLNPWKKYMKEYEKLAKAWNPILEEDDWTRDLFG